MPFSYANPGSGPSAGGIGWFNFENLTINPGQTVPGLTGTLNDGTTVTFDLTMTKVSGDDRPYVATTVPTFPGANFGVAGYTGIPGNVALYGVDIPTVGSNLFTVSNIVVNDAGGNPINNYTLIYADAERTNNDEVIVLNTNGAGWGLLATLGANPPTLTGVGTTTATITGNSGGPSSAYVLTTQAPTQMTLRIDNGTNSRQAFSLGFAITKVTLEKNVASRIDPSDQFQLNISGNPSSTATTAGTAAGIQTQKASIFATPGSAYMLNEAMAAGSASTLSQYTQIVSGSNATPGGSVPPTGNLPVSFTPALGDNVTYTVLNVAPPLFNKAVNKAYADIGELVTYTITVNNANDVAISNVLVTDPTPAGTTYANNLQVSAPFTGTDPASGLTITSIPAGGTVTISYQVQVNTAPPIPLPITNVATVSVPGGPTGTTNAVTTQVRTAVLSLVKSSDHSFVQPGDILTYSIVATNMGNTDANNVNITDAVPAGTTFVAGSVTGATGTPPTLTLNNSVPAGGSATVTFQVKVNNEIPNPNPIPNNASADFTYTVDPANPNAASGTAASNTITNQVNSPLITSNKTVDKAFAQSGDILTYTIVVNNGGNVAADNVVITDTIPAGTTFVAGSVTGATGTPPTLTLNNPVPAGGSATVTFQVQVNPGTPAPNPLPNSATVNYQFTLNPINPDGASGTSTTNAVQTQVNQATITTTKTVDKAYASQGSVLTYTLTLKNTGNVAADSVTINDAIPAGTTFVAGSVIGAMGTPPTLTLMNPIAAGGSAVVSYQVLVGNATPNPNPIPNQAEAAFTFTLDPANPDGANGTSTSNQVTSQINTAVVTTTKTVDKTFAQPNDVLTYTITLNNSGNVAANQVVVSDAIPAGTTFVANSLVGATGTPPTLTLTNPIPAGGNATITYQVKVGNAVPSINPLANTASAAFTYTMDPASPNGATGTSNENTVTTQINVAKLNLTKQVDKTIAYIGDVITYQIAINNSGNTAANAAVLKDLIPANTSYVANSIQASAPYTGDLASGLQFTNPIAAGSTVTLSFQVKVDAIPNPNPIVNMASITYTYTVDPADPNGVSATASSNAVSSVVFRYNYAQQVSDLIQSVALEQAALANIANAEGAKIQAMVAMGNITTQELLCLNKSVAAMIESISMLEMILKQKLSAVSCQIDATGAGC